MTNLDIVIASAAKQPSVNTRMLDCFATLAMTGGRLTRANKRPQVIRKFT